MLGAIDQLKIGKRIVAPVTIDVMNIVTLWNRAMMVRPDTAMQKPLTVTEPRALIVSTRCLNSELLSAIDNELSTRHDASLHFVRGSILSVRLSASSVLMPAPQQNTL